MEGAIDAEALIERIYSDRVISQRSAVKNSLILCELISTSNNFLTMLPSYHILAYLIADG
ncbi:MAG: hypothetical protein CW694_01265 [Candidatus Syntrophoarchaeum sp. WYZ-LMO15]|nr:MAG: hypothetical protein CW694_01265 [Candidatus Syntrophoarchaeum sp. WYZ-LMO15]